MNKEEQKISKKLKRAIRDLKVKRKEFIQTEIKMESLFLGRLRRLGLLKRESYPGYLRARTTYFSALSAFRREIIDFFRKDSRTLLKLNLRLIYQITVEDEIGRLKKEKEEKRRSALLTGYIREKVQDYREIHPGFKMGLGLVFTLIALVCLVLGVENYSLIQAVVLTLGIMISFEGFWQEYSIRKGIRLNLTRAQALRKARRAVGSGTKDLEPRFRRIHQELEKDIWQIRRFEKRAEYKRYVFAVFGGAFLGALIAWPHGTDLMIETFFLAGFSHLFLYLILPFGLIGVFIIERENEYYARDAYQKEDEALKSVCKSCML